MAAHQETIKGSGTGTSIVSGSMTSAGSELWLVSALVYDAGGAVTITAQLDGVTSFTRDRSQLLDVPGGNANEEQLAIFSLPDVASGSHSVTVAFTGINVDAVTIFVSRFSGMATSSVVDGTGASATGTSTAAASGTFTTTNSDGVFYGAAFTESGSNPATVTNSTWTIPTNGSELDGSANIVGGVAYLINPGTTSGNAQFTVDNVAWIAMGIGYKVAVAAASNIIPPHYGRPFPYTPGSR